MILTNFVNNMAFDSPPYDISMAAHSTLGELPLIQVDRIPFRVYKEVETGLVSENDIGTSWSSTTIYIESLEGEPYVTNSGSSEKRPIAKIYYEVGSNKIDIGLDLTYEWSKIISDQRNLKVIGQVITNAVKLYKSRDSNEEAYEKSELENIGIEYIPRRCRVKINLEVDRYDVNNILRIVNTILPDLEVVPVTPLKSIRVIGNKKYAHYSMGVQER